MRHASPVTTLRHYQKATPESVRSAVDEFDVEIMLWTEKSRTERAAAVAIETATLSVN